jgi:putative multiple sugar transport system substrate-binding protein
MKKFTLWILVLLFVSMVTCLSLAQSVEVGIVLPTKDEPRWIQDKLVSMMP